MSIEFHGVQNGLALFSSGTQAVLINSTTFDVFDTKTLAEFDTTEFEPNTESLTNLGLLTDLAEDALPASLGDVTIIAATKPRTYRVPKAVQENAQYALSRVRKTKNYGDPVAMFAARSLARGGSIPLSQIKNLSRFFAMTAALSDAADSDDAQLAWELFGGDAARRWSFSITSRSSALVAAAEAAAPATAPAEAEDDDEDVIDAPPDEETIDGGTPHMFEEIEALPGMCMYCAQAELIDLHVTRDELPSDHPQLLSIGDYEEEWNAAAAEYDAENPPAEPVAAAGYRELQEDAFPTSPDIKFYAERLTADPLTLTRLLHSNFEGAWKRFEGEAAEWKECAAPDPSDDLIRLDEDTAYAMIEHLATENTSFDLRNSHPEESTLVELAGDSIDDELGLLNVDTDEYEEFANEYTREERSTNAQRQVRDKDGRFARSGTAIDTDGGRSGRVVGFDKGRNKVEVKMDDNARSEYWDQSQIRIRQTAGSPNIGHGNKPTPNDAAHKRAEARQDIRQSVRQAERVIRQAEREAAKLIKAKLSEAREVLNPDKIKELLDVYEQFIKDERRRRSSGLEDASDPTTSDVKPVHLAIVDKLDPTAVLDLVALAPKNPESTEIVAFRREDKKWVEDSNLLLQLKSVAPPPVVTLDEATYQDVVAQVDAWIDESSQPPASEEPRPPEAKSLPPQAAADIDIDMLLPAYGEHGETIELSYEGGLDRNRGGAARLRRYWLYGPGAAKIVWNTPGDWTRCVGFLSKYMGVRAKGYCALRHKEATGLWTGDQLHRTRGFSDSDDDLLPTSEDVISASVTRASLVASHFESPVPDSVQDVQNGTPFLIPILVPIGVETGDGRTFASDSLTTRDFPLSLMWQIKTGSAHDGAVIVGRIDGCDTTEAGLVNAYGVLDTGIYAQEAERLIRGKFLRGVSADLDQFEASQESSETLGKDDDDTEPPKDDVISADRMMITSARLSGATLVPKPAFQEVEILLDDPSEELMPLDDGEYVGAPDEADVHPLMAAAMIASGIPIQPPRSWFDDPHLKEPTPLTVDNNGRVYGHIAAWHVDHIGLPFSTKPPRSRTNYSYFHTGMLACDDDSRVPVGQLTLAGGHASLEASASEAVRHYDDTASAVADVHAGEDEHGIWVAGGLRPGISPEQIRTLRASAPSGDWRPINGRLEMVAVCQVNVPGFPITRARVASGHMYALVAAGASVLAKMRSTPWDEQNSILENRLAKLEIVERTKLSKAREDAINRVAPIRNEAVLTAAALVIDKVNEMRPDEATAFADVSDEKRAEYAKRGWAREDGSYPITDISDLKKAIQAYGRSDPEDRTKVRRHIMKRARGLGRADLIPDKWTSASVDERFQDVRQQFTSLRDADLLAEAHEIKSRFAELAETDTTRRMISRNPDFDEANHPRDNDGKFRDVVAKLRENLKNTPEAEEAVKELDDAAQAEAEKNFEKARLAADRAIHILDAAATGVRNIGTAETMRDAAKQLGRVIAFLPVAVGNDSVASSFEQLAPEVQNLIQDLVERAEKVRDPSEDASADLESIKGFISGGDQWTQPELNSALSRMIRILL